MKQFIKKDRGIQKPCPYCNTLMSYDIMQLRPGVYIQIHECLNGCKLTYAQQNESILDNTNTFIYYEEKEDV